jgi:3-hydroxyisobutyrate dehydrogenase
MAQETEPVAFVGIGTMGHAIATRALEAAIPTVVWNRGPDAMRGLSDLGAGVAESAADAARQAAIVVTMVTDADVVMAIAKDQGMLAALAPGAIWAQMSTIGDEGMKRVESLVRDGRPDVILIDVPVSGSKEPAEQGQLTIFASGPEAVRGRLDPLFDALGRRTIWVGSVGSGSKLKLIANVWLTLAAEALNVSVALAHQLGLETESVVNALGDGPLVSPWQRAKLERIARGDFSVQFAGERDLTIVAQALEEQGGRE